MTDSDFMSEALSLAAKGMGFVNPNPMVGAVIVRDGEIIGTAVSTLNAMPLLTATAVMLTVRVPICM